MGELLKPLLCYGGLDVDGSPRVGESDVDCDCYLTYRGPSHGELQAAPS